MTSSIWPLSGAWAGLETEAARGPRVGPGSAVGQLDDLVRPLVRKWLSNAIVRGITLRVEFPAAAALWPGELSPVRLLLDGLIGDAIDTIAPPGGCVSVRVSLPSRALLRLSVRRSGSREVASTRKPGGVPARPTGREAALDLLREVVRAHCGRLLRRRSRYGELMRVDLPRLTEGMVDGSGPLTPNRGNGAT